MQGLGTDIQTLGGFESTSARLFVVVDRSRSFPIGGIFPRRVPIISFGSFLSYFSLISIIFFACFYNIFRLVSIIFVWFLSYSIIFFPESVCWMFRPHPTPARYPHEYSARECLLLGAESRVFLFWIVCRKHSCGNTGAEIGVWHDGNGSL